MNNQIKKYVRRKAIALNYQLGRYSDVVWLVGDGRSGTTWVSDLINWDGRRREMFEPFHPRRVKATNQFHRHQYLRPSDSHNVLGVVLHDIFSGKFQHPRVDDENKALIYRGLLIKDIFANLLVGWVSRNIRPIKKILLVRNPFSVALSKAKTKHWGWVDEPKDFLLQPELSEDYLNEFADVIRDSSADYIQRQLIIWSIIYLVPLRQLNKGDIFVLFYENLYTDPEAELNRIFTFLNEGKRSGMDSKLMEVFHRPSRVSARDSHRVPGKSPTSEWKSQLSRQQIDDGLRTLERLGLAEIYGEDEMPSLDALERYMDRY